MDGIVQRREVLEILQNELNALVRKLARQLAQELNSIQTIKLETLSRRESLGPSEDHIQRLCRNVRALPRASRPDTTTSLPKGDELVPPPIPLPTTDSLLLSPSDPPSTTISPLPTFLPASAMSMATGTSVLQNTNALHNELSEQLAQMATQLQRNALHLSDSLSADKFIVEEAQQKIESNFNFMRKERVNLRDFRGKSGSTTCLVVMSIIVVTVLFIFMVMLIHLTR
ncbi:uncharacterized protein ARMOST_15407 [Armillaria ostoyae]|uniref:Uncharacterized protein n=1 Tax=Armillaria ostoyae TaxID=47428 RepID=A0A284RTE1_ARMOS|nr:uncharacterized protein ARMOST_15407 [Armillaria ostoyae]